MNTINYDLITKAYTVAGILAGFAFTAGIEILLHFQESPTVINSKYSLIRNVWLYFVSSVLLITTYASLAAISNYSPRFSTIYPKLESVYTELTNILVFVFLIGIFLLLAGIVFSMLSLFSKPSDSLFDNRKIQVVLVGSIILLSLGFIFFVFITPVLNFLH